MKLTHFLKENLKRINDPVDHRSIWADRIKRLVFSPIYMFGYFLKRKSYGISLFLFLGALYVGSTFKPYGDNLITTIFYALIKVYFLILIFNFLIFLGALDFKRKKMIENCRKRMGGQINFSNKQIIEADKVLRKFKPMFYDKAIEKYGQDIMDLLFVANAVFFYTQKKGFFSNEVVVKRLVSIRSIEEDREAD